MTAMKDRSLDSFATSENIGTAAKRKVICDYSTAKLIAIAQRNAQNQRKPMIKPLEQVKREAVILRVASLGVTKAASSLGIQPQHLRLKLKRYGVFELFKNRQRGILCQEPTKHF
jgi:DNA-binding NtrC family response regulator